MALTRRVHGAATLWTTSQPIPFSIAAAQGDGCYLVAYNIAAIGAAPAGWTERLSLGPVAGYYVKIFKLNGNYPASAPSQPTVTATGGSGGVAYIEHWYTDASGKAIEDEIIGGTDTDTSSTAFSATGSSITTIAGDVILAILGLKSTNTMTAGPSAITLTQTGATFGTQVGNFGSRLAGSTPTNSLHYGTYHRPVTAGATGTPIMTATASAGGTTAAGTTGFIRLREVTSNVAPTANAGSDQTKTAGSLVTLNGTGSSDSDGNIASYAWTPPGGITLSSNTASQPTFTAPYSMTQQVYSFSLVVTDNLGASSVSDSVDITVPAHPEWYHNGTTWKPEIHSML